MSRRPSCPSSDLAVFVPCDGLLLWVHVLRENAEMCPVARGGNQVVEDVRLID